jgi:collagen type III alpha
MASSPEDYSDAGHPSALDDSPGSGSHAHGAEGYVDFDEYIDIQLRKAGSTIKSTDVMTAVVGAGTLLATYLLIFIVLDQWLVPGGFSPTSRLLLLSALLVGVAGWIGWKVLWPWRRRVNGLYSASTIEKASPGFKGSLVNLVDLLRAEREIPPEIYRSLERRAAVALTHVDVRESVDRHLLLRLSMALFAVVVLFCGYWIFSPKNPASSFWRAIAPASDATVATRTKIDLVRPGDVDVVARSQVDVTAEVRGQMPPQATLYYTTADRKFVDERIDARPTAEASREFHFVINGDNGAGILQDMSYRIVAGDDSSRDYKIHVIQPPAATIDSIRLDYPEYTRLGTSTQTTGAIDALEGTRVTLRATANMPLRSASLQFFDDDSASRRAEEVPVHIESGNKLQAEWPLQFRADGSYAHFYRIFCTSVGGESERAPTLYSVEIRADRRPEIVLLDPKTDLELPANAELPLLFEARDPDFALTYINLKIEKDGASVGGDELYDGHDHPDQHVKKSYKWSLKNYHFRPKDTVTYWLEAQDNRKPEANRTGTSPQLRIHITDPVPESQVKKDFLMAENKQREEAKRSEDKSAQPKPDDEQAPDAPKPRQDGPKPQPKDKPQNANSAKEQKPAEQEQAEQQNADQQNKNGDKGSGGEGESKGSGGGEKGDKGNAENGQAGQSGQSQKPNPDDPSSDPKALQTMHDHFQKEGDKGGNGSESKPQDGNKDSKGKNGDDKSGEQKREQSGSQSPQDGNSANDKRENQPGQPGAKPQPGSQSNPQSNSSDGQNQPDGKNNKDGQNQDGKKPDGKEGQNPDQSANRRGAGSNRDLNQERQPQSQIPAGGDKNPKGGSDKDANANPQGKKPGEGGGENQPGEKPKPDNQGGAQPNGERPAPDKQPADKEAGQKQSAEKQPRDKTGQKSEAAQKPEAGQNSEAGKKQEPGQKSEPGQPSDQGQEQGQQTKPGDKSQSPSKEARDGKEKGQPSPGDQSSSDKKNQNAGRSSDSNSQPDQGKPDPSQNRSNGAKPGDQKGDERSQSGNPQQDASQRNNGQDQDGSKTSKPADEQAGGKPESAAKDRKDATKNADPTGRNGERTPQPQQDAGAKPHPGQPQDSPQNFNPKETPPGEKPDAKAAKRRPNNQDPEENAKAIDQNTDKLHSKSMRDEKQSNSKGDEQSDVGKTGDTKRTLDKNAPLSQKGTENDGAKEKTTEQGPPSKDGKEKPSQKEQSGQERPGQDGGPPKSGQQSPEGQPKEGQPGQKGQPGQNGQQTQSGQQGQDAKQGKEGQPGQQGDGKPGQPGQGQQSGNQAGGDKPSKPGQSTASGMGDGNGTNTGGGGHNNGTGNGQGEGLVNTEKEANLDYARKATDLILNRLQGQLSRGQVDEKLLKELGWTKDEVRRFVERMRRQAQSEQGGNTPADEARRLQFEETLRSLELKQSPKSRSGAGVKKVGGVEIENRRSTPPPEFRELYDAYTKSLSNSQTPREKK